MNGTALPTPVNPNLYKYPKQPAGPAPAIIPPAPPPSSNGHNHVLNPHNHAHSHPNTPQLNRTNQTNHANGAHPPKAKKKNEPPPVDPATMYESLKSRIAVLEEEETQEEEEERRFGTQFWKSVSLWTAWILRSSCILQLKRRRNLSREWERMLFTQSISNWYANHHTPVSNCWIGL